MMLFTAEGFVAFNENVTVYLLEYLETTLYPAMHLNTARLQDCRNEALFMQDQ